jgi:hypothetical protein
MLRQMICVDRLAVGADDARDVRRLHGRAFDEANRDLTRL